MLQYVTWAIMAYGVGGIAAWALRRRAVAASHLGALGCILAAGLGLYGVGGCLFLRQLESSRQLWNVPLASMNLGLDSLSAWFLIPVFLVGGLVAIAALRNLPGDYAANRPHEHWLFLNFTLGGAALAIVARNAVLFLFAWELMTVASFMLVENTQRTPGSRTGGWVYLSAGHLGCAALFALFALLGAGKGMALDFSALSATGGALSAAFLLAVVGFGAKIGLFPFQSYYPEAYPPAPAHVGAVLSGVVGNLGIYGMLRILYLLGGEVKPPLWWGYLLLYAGLASGVVGAARALASKDLSRLLAWSSVENYGLMASGIGLGLLGASAGNGVLSYLGFTATILHMLNHSISKSLLFLGAGTVYARTGTRSLDRMGGLMHRLPLTGILFLIGAMGAACVPPLNGFAGEFLLLAAAFQGAGGYNPASVAAATMFLAVVLFALVGGLAVASYCKAFGFVFLGNDRNPGAVSTVRENRRLLLPHLVLAAVALVFAGASSYLMRLISPTAETLVHLWRRSPVGNHDLELWLGQDRLTLLDSAFVGCWLLGGCVALVYLFRTFLLRGKKRDAAPTWDCGYAAPTNRMQYTASSFARPLAENLQPLVNVTDQEEAPRGLFPTSASFLSRIPLVETAWGFSHLFKLFARIAGRIRVMQAGRVQVYLLYMAVALVVLLLWKL
ncbi:MAG: hypothetical protein LUC93_13330 [Planctomycetaceae bacterium]|nr:hypothetical protein [Planctomycetaceae bacterium]